MIDPRLVTESFDITLGHSADVQALLVARALYAKVRRRGALRWLWAALGGGWSGLVPLREVPGAFPSPGERLRRAQVPIAQICGSEGRDHDFDRHFAPTQSHTRERWLSVAVAWYQCQPLPPVRLVAVGDAYYVRDGHHRISVARAFGADSVEAEVERWQLAAAPAPVPAAGLLPRAW